jgi:hypothetical protein
MHRCYDEKNSHWHLYGERGIKVSQEFKDVVVFVNYCKALPNFDLNLEIDRIDTNGNYERGNLRWATRKMQVENRRCTRYISFQGHPMPAVDFIKNHIKKYHPLTVWNLVRKEKLTGEQILAREASSLRAGESYQCKNPKGFSRKEMMA